MSVDKVGFNNLSTGKKVAVVAGAAVGAAAVGATVAAAIKGKGIVNDAYIASYKANHDGKELKGFEKARTILKEGFHSLFKPVQEFFKKTFTSKNKENAGNATGKEAPAADKVGAEQGKTDAAVAAKQGETTPVAQDATAAAKTTETPEAAPENAENK